MKFGPLDSLHWWPLFSWALRYFPRQSELKWTKNFKALYHYKFDQKQQEGVLTIWYWCVLHSGKFGKSILWKMSLLLKPDEMFLWSDITIKKKINSREKNNIVWILFRLSIKRTVKAFEYLQNQFTRISGNVEKNSRQKLGSKIFYDKFLKRSLEFEWTVINECSGEKVCESECILLTHVFHHIQRVNP